VPRRGASFRRVRRDGQASIKAFDALFATPLIDQLPPVSKSEFCEPFSRKIHLPHGFEWRRSWV